MSSRLPFARRMQYIEPFHVMALLARARELQATGREIIHMEVGEPDFVAPQPVLAAAQQALAEGKTHYTAALGLPELRRAVADFYRDFYGVSIAPERVVITPGASGALQLALGVLVNPGDQVIVSDPGYPCSSHLVRLFEGVPKAVPVDKSTGYQLTAEQLQQHWQPEVVATLLASPSNPTGSLLDSSELAQMQRFCEQQGAALIVDEVYQGLLYGVSPSSAVELSDQIFVVNSFSKFFGMTGFRLGWLIAPEAYLERIERLAQNLFLSPPTVSQYAALAAFREETLLELEQRRRAFQQRRDYLLPELQALGFEIPLSPQGAFYLYADASRFTHNSGEFAYQLLEKAGVAVTPGIDFGHFRAGEHLRFAYTTETALLAKGIERLANFIQKSR